MHLDRESCYRALLTRDARFDGQFFTAVRTTGIYCRPICPARTPKLEHVIFLPSAAAAQAAGFRPCLRCRPETSPETAAWRGTYGTVSRALALIAAGALDEDDVEGLAGRLGIGARQLRRLFHQHLGASPKAVAGTRRVLFAKRLITDTSLPMTDVALAAGFGSLRRFNDIFRRLYGRPPSRLRRAGRALEPPESGVALTLPFKPPYDWAGLIGFLAARAIPGVERVSADSYARTISMGGASGTITVRPDLTQLCLTATIRFPLIGEMGRIVNRIRCLFDLGADPCLIGAQLSADPAMAARVRARPGLRVPGAWDGFELGVRAILGQQISVGAATALAGKLVAAYGTRLAPEPGVAGLTHAFPSPLRIAEASDLAGTLGMPRARAAAITSLAAAAVEDPRLFEPGRGLEASVARLRALPGIGAWTAQYIAMRALREPDAFPAADIGLLRAMAGSEGRPSPTQLAARAEAWRPWRAYAALHLWAPPPHAIKEKPNEALARPSGIADRDDSARL